VATSVIMCIQRLFTSAKAAPCLLALLLVGPPACLLASDSSEVQFFEDDDLAQSSCLLQVEMHLARASSNASSNASQPVAAAVAPGKLAAAVAVARLTSPAHIAAEAIAALWIALPRWTAQSTHTIAMAVLAVFTTLAMLTSFMKSEGKDKSIFALVAYPVAAGAGSCKKRRERLKGVTPPWELQQPEGSREYSREARKGGKKAGRVGAPRIVLPRLCPGWDGGKELTESCAVVDMEGLMQLWKAPVDIKNASGKKVMEASVRESGDGLYLLELTIAGQANGPHAIIRGIGGDYTNMEVFGHAASQSYFTLVWQPGGGTKLLRAGQTAMLLQAGFAADLRVMALRADGDFLASGGRYLGVSRGANNVWKLRLSGGVDCVLIIACMLATILTQLQASAPQPTLDIASSDDEEQATLPTRDVLALG